MDKHRAPVWNKLDGEGLTQNDSRCDGTVPGNFTMTVLLLGFDHVPKLDTQQILIKATVFAHVMQNDNLVANDHTFGFVQI